MRIFLVLLGQKDSQLKYTAFVCLLSSLFFLPFWFCSRPTLSWMLWTTGQRISKSLPPRKVIAKSNWNTISTSLYTKLLFRLLYLANLFNYCGFSELWSTNMSIFVLDTIVTSKNVQVIWNPHTMRRFTICACCYSGLPLKNLLVGTLVAEAETRTSNLCPTQYTWYSMCWTREYTMKFHLLTCTKLYLKSLPTKV